MSSGTFPDGTGTWSYSSSPGITVTWTPAPSPGGAEPAAPSLNIVIDANSSFLASGGNITFNAPPPPAGTYVPGTFYDGLIENLQITLENDSGYTINGFDLKLVNTVPTQTPDTGDVHPDNYAHIHDIQPTTFGTGETLSLLTPNDLAGAFGPEGSKPAPSEINAVGDIADGASVTGNGMVLHEEEDPGRNNSFSLNISASAPPVVAPENRAVRVNQSIPASSLIASVSDAYGYPITYYQFYDAGNDSGILSLNGVSQPFGTWFSVSASDLQDLSFLGSSTLGTDSISIEAWDGQNWSDASVATVETIGADQPISNFHNNLGSEILWQNTNGQAAIWEMNGTNVVGGGVVGPNPGPGGWSEIGTGDFNGDGQSDILWQNAAGQVAIWEDNGTNVIGAAVVGPNPGPSWKAIGTGDFNDDGHSDILWQNTTTGQAAIWEMNGTNVIGGGTVGPLPGAGWNVIGTGDFNDDGHSDILWQNTTTGQAAIWEMNGTNIVGAAVVGPVPGPGWKAMGTGDFNDDGYSDILWQNVDGRAAIWEMNGTSVIGAAVVGPNPGPGWTETGTGDFNGDGHSDILWQNTSGQAAIWEMNGTNVIGGGLVGPNPGQSWLT